MANASTDEKAEALVQLLGKRYCAALMLSVVFMAVAPPVGRGGSSKPRPRAHWRPRISLMGIVSGLIGAVGVFVLLQQYAVIYPTRTAGIIALVIGLVAGLVLPSLGRLRAVRKINRRIDSLYR